MAGHFNICLSVTDRTSHKKIEEDIEDLSDASHELDIYTKHWTKDSGICMLFMYMYKFQRIATQSMVFDPSGDKLKIIFKKENNQKNSECLEIKQCIFKKRIYNIVMKGEHQMLNILTFKM